MTTNQKSLIAILAALAAGFTIYQVTDSRGRSLAERSGHSGNHQVAHDGASSDGRPGAHGRLSAGGPRTLLQPRLTEEGRRQLQTGPETVLSAHATGNGEAWSPADDNLLVAWAAQNPAAALAWVNGSDWSVTRAQLLGAVAAGILLKDGREVMERFLDAHQEDPGLRGKDRGDLERYLFYQLGRDDTFDAAMEILAERNDASLAGSLVAGIHGGAQFQTSALDYMDAKGIPVAMDYWTHQAEIGKDPRYWADWAWKRGSDMLPEIVDGWARSDSSKAKAWVEERIPKDDKHRAEIDDLLQTRDESGNNPSAE